MAVGVGINYKDESLTWVEWKWRWAGGGGAVGGWGEEVGSWKVGGGEAGS